MDIYTLEDESLGRDKVIDEYESLIWTERHIEAGEVQLVVPGTEFNYGLLKSGTLLGHMNSQELMLVDTRSVKEGMLTASGKSLETFLDERNNGAFDAVDTPAGIMGDIVQNMISRYEYVQNTDLEYVTFALPIVIGYLDPGDGEVVEEKIEEGPCYTNLMKIARKYGCHFGLYRVSNDIGSWDLHFSVHVGKDRTSEQSVNKVVRFSPGMDSLGDTEDLSSDVGFKSVVVAMPPKGLEIQIGKVSVTPDPIMVSRVANAADDWQPWRSRVLEVNCDDIKLKDLGPEGTSGTDQMARLYEIMEARARRALRKQQRPDMVAGEITPDAPYKYKSDNSDPAVTTFDLGDRVEFGGHFGEIRQGTVTEYVRSSDSSGSRSYPTVSEKATPVLQTQLGEQVISWGTTGDGWNPEGTGFWSESDISLAKPLVFEADADTLLLTGDGDVNRVGTATKIRFRWGTEGSAPEDTHYLEWDVPEPPAGASDLRATLVSYTDFINDPDTTWTGFALTTNAGGYYLWVWDGDSGFWYEQPSGDQAYYYTYADIFPDGFQGWTAVTRILQTSIALV